MDDIDASRHSVNNNTVWFTMLWSDAILEIMSAGIVKAAFKERKQYRAIGVFLA